MKELVICRHAKSSWKFKIDDIYRPLDKNGVYDAPDMAERWEGEAPDLILCSPAVRTYSTALAYIEENDWPIESLKLHPNIYQADSDTLMKILHKLNGQSRVWLVGHNPGVSDLINYLTSRMDDDIDTGTRVHLACDIDSWSTLTDGCAEITAYKSPTRLEDD